jgi:hypothetical protein
MILISSSFDFRPPWRGICGRERVYGLKRGEESIFADILEDFAMPSCSNYPYPYAFDNHEEQFKIASAHP